MIKLWGRPNAYNVQKVMWALGELNVNFAQKDIGSTPGDLESEDFKKLNPHSRIPVLVDGEAVIWESNTIIRYLFSEYSTSNFTPTDRIEKTHIERWMDWELATLQPDIVGIFWCFYRTPEASRNNIKIDYHKARCSNHLLQLDQLLETQPYLAGELFSMADVCCATGLYRYFNMGIDANRPKHLMRWYDDMTSRPAYRENIMLSFKSLKGRLEF